MAKVTKNKVSTRESLLLAARKQRDAIENEMYEDVRQRLMTHFETFPCKDGYFEEYRGGISGKVSKFWRKPVEFHHYYECKKMMAAALKADWGDHEGIDIGSVVDRAYDSIAWDGLVYTDHKGQIFPMGLGENVLEEQT